MGYGFALCAGGRPGDAACSERAKLLATLQVEGNARLFVDLMINDGRSVPVSEKDGPHV
jgi:hypothetical protein